FPGRVPKTPQKPGIGRADGAALERSVVLADPTGYITGTGGKKSQNLRNPLGAGTALRHSQRDIPIQPFEPIPRCRTGAYVGSAKARRTGTQGRPLMRSCLHNILKPRCPFSSSVTAWLVPFWRPGFCSPGRGKRAQDHTSRV